MKLEELKKELETRQNKSRSAWDKGVYSYAVEMVENIQNDSIMSQEQDAEKHDVSDFVNHVDGRGISMSDFWTMDARIKVHRLCDSSSWGGNFDIYDGSIVERLCTPSEIRRYNSGRMQNGPTSRERWMDTQTRAINSAIFRIHGIIRDNIKSKKRG